MFTPSRGPRYSTGANNDSAAWRKAVQNSAGGYTIPGLSLAWPRPHAGTCMLGPTFFLFISLHCWIEISS